MRVHHQPDRRAKRRRADVVAQTAHAHRGATADRQVEDLLADLWLELGERKIDIVLDDGSAPSAVVDRARREGVEL